MNSLIIIPIAVLVLMVGGFLAATPHAFALKNFFSCITDISAKDGGDHNLTLQQVIDCFHKEFPSNDFSSSHFSSHSSIDTIVNGHHIHSEIIN